MQRGWQGNAHRKVAQRFVETAVRRSILGPCLREDDADFSNYYRHIREGGNPESVGERRWRYELGSPLTVNSPCKRSNNTCKCGTGQLCRCATAQAWPIR